MEKENPYIELVKLIKKCRKRMLNDTILAISPDLYDALYSEPKTKIYETKFELYELKWLEYHWKRVCEVIDVCVCSERERKEVISLVARRYGEFISNWNYSEFDIAIFEEKMNILKTLIVVNDEWDNNLKRMKVSFVQSEKALKLRIKELESGV